MTENTKKDMTSAPETPTPTETGTTPTTEENGQKEPKGTCLQKAINLKKRINKCFYLMFPIAVAIFLITICVAFFSPPPSAWFFAALVAALLALSFILVCLLAKVEDRTSQETGDEDIMHSIVVIVLVLLILQYAAIDYFIFTRIKDVGNDNSSLLSTWINATLVQSIIAILAILSKEIFKRKNDVDEQK